MLEPGQLNLSKLYHQFDDLHIQTLSVTSTESGEGKTTIVYGLAQYALKDKKRVLIIDLNSINPSLTTHFLNHHHNELDASQWVPQPTSQNNLFILPAPHHAQLIFQLSHKQTLSEIITRHENSFDQILIDCSAINTNGPDTIPPPLIASMSKGVAIVVMSCKTGIIDLEQAIAQLKKQNAPLLGAIMNDQYNPGLLSELITGTHRFDKTFPKLMPRLRKFLQKQPVLRIEI